MKEYGLSDQVRSIARDRYVLPALRGGRVSFSIHVRQLLDDLIPLGFPATNTPQVCNALRSKKFLQDNGLEITSIDGPPSKQSTTVVVHYHAIARKKAVHGQDLKERVGTEDPKGRATRLAEALRGLLKDELRQYGGAEEFIRWVRSDDEEAA